MKIPITEYLLLKDESIVWRLGDSDVYASTHAIRRMEERDVPVDDVLLALHHPNTRRKTDAPGVKNHMKHIGDRRVYVGVAQQDEKTIIVTVFTRPKPIRAQKDGGDD